MSQISQEQLPQGVSLAQACRVLGLNRGTVYARRGAGLSDDQRAANRVRKHCPQPRALSKAEREYARACLYSAPFRDQPPAEIYYQLLEQGE